jgi:hypothetical protein
MPAVIKNNNPSKPSTITIIETALNNKGMLGAVFILSVSETVFIAVLFQDRQALRVKVYENRTDE